eukprot:243425-Lingulodinium_polyedra.AAC.1
MASPAASGKEAAVEEPELQHEGRVQLNTSGEMQWVTHAQTGEKQWCPPAPSLWQLSFHNGFGFLHNKTTSMWLSGENGLLRKSLHRCSKTNELFVMNRGSKKREWLHDLAKQYKDWKCTVQTKQPVQLWLWELLLPSHGSTVFFSLN